MRIDGGVRRELARRRRLALASLYVLFFGLIAALSLASPRGWMPGPLSEEHEFTGERCDACHAPASDDIGSRCANCHNNVTLDKEWREHRRGELIGATGGSVSAGALSRTVGSAGIVGAAAAASGSAFFGFVVWGRVATQKRRRRRSRPSTSTPNRKG